MTPFSSFQPRDHHAAGRAASVLALVAATVTAAFSWLPSARGGAQVGLIVPTVVCCVAVVACAWLTRRLSPAHHILWGVLPFAAIAVILALDLATSDASVSAQVFLVFPTLYAASQLPRVGAAAVTAAAVLADIAIVCAFLPPLEALTDIAYVSAALVTTAALLVLAGERQDLLVVQLERQAAIDPLTGLATRRVLDQAARSALSGGMNAVGTALILVDVDDFKSVNDLHGHPGGDAVLVQLAQLFTRACRSGDIVSRIGGDEIALLLPGCSVDAAGSRAAEILRLVKEFSAVTDHGSRIEITVTAGFAHSPTHATDLRGLYTMADEALYHAKRAGKDRVGSPVSP